MTDMGDSAQGSRADAAGRPAPTPADVLRRAGQAVERWTRRLVEGPLWQLKVLVSATVASVLCAAPNVSSIDTAGDHRDWTYIIRKGHDLMYQDVSAPFYRTANLTFRLTVPAVGGRLGFSSPYAYFALQCLAGVLLFLVTARLFDRILDDRVLAAVLTVAVGLTYVGSTAFVETRGNFDGVAMLLLAAAALARRPPLIVLAGLAAAFTDERAVVALGLVFVFHALEPLDDVGPQPLRRYVNPRSLSVVGSVVLYGGLRVFLSHRYGLDQPQSEFNEESQLNIAPIGIWTGLEGLWLVVVAGLVALWQARRRWLVVLAVAVGAVSMGIALLVFDVTRSMIYVFPLVFVAAVGLRRLDRAWVQRLAWITLTLCVVWPVYYAGGQKTVLWNYPLPVLLVQKALGL